MRIFNEIGRYNFRGDLFGGITAAVIALPMALAFGVASGAGAEAGLYGAIFVGFFAALFGGSPTLISEPTGPMTVVFTAVIAKLIASDPVNGMAMAFTVVVMAGMFQILFGVMKLGKYVTLMPYTVVSGFMSGIGIILIILQIGPLLGQASPSGGVIAVLKNLPVLFSGIQTNETILAILTVAILFLIPKKLKQYLPPPLVALIVCTFISVVFFSATEIRRIGEIPTGLPDLQLPAFSPEQWQVMIIDAIVLGMLGCIDALLTSVVADSITRKRHNSDKELIGQGIGNIMSGLFGGLPGAGATMGTVVSIQAGARTALAGIVRAGILLVVILWAADLTSVIPLAVLAGIALKVGINIIDWSFLKRAHLISGKGALITYGVILLTDPDDTDLELSEREKEILRDAQGKILLLYLRGTMIFGSSRAITRKNSQIGGCHTLVVDITDVKHLGVSAALALEESILEMVTAGRSVYIVTTKEQALQRLGRLDVLKHIPEENIIVGRLAALERISAKQ